MVNQLNNLELFKNNSISNSTTKLPGTELPKMKTDDVNTEAKFLKNLTRNPTSSLKNPFMGQKASNTLARHDQSRMAKDGLNDGLRDGIYKETKIQENTDLRKILIESNTIDFKKPTLGTPGTSNKRNLVNPYTGHKSSAVSGMSKIVDNSRKANIHKLRKDETLGIQKMSDRKKNQGLVFLNKMSQGKV